MSDVQFDEDQSIARPTQFSVSKPPFFVQFMISRGWVSTQKQGETVLLWIAGVAVIIAIAVFQFGKGHGHPSVPQNIPLTPGAHAP